MAALVELHDLRSKFPVLVLVSIVQALDRDRLLPGLEVLAVSCNLGFLFDGLQAKQIRLLRDRLLRSVVRMVVRGPELADPLQEPVR